MQLILRMINLLTFRGDLFHCNQRPRYQASHPLDYEIVNENIRIFIQQNMQSQSTSEIIGDATAIDIDNVDALMGLDLQNQIAASTITGAGIGTTATGDDETIMDKTDGETQSKVMRR